MKLIEWQGVNDFEDEELHEYVEYYRDRFSMHGYYFAPDFCMEPFGPIQEDSLKDYTIDVMKVTAFTRAFKACHDLKEMEQYLLFVRSGMLDFILSKYENKQ